MKNKRIGILGYGAYAMALTSLLQKQRHHKITLWIRDPKIAQSINVDKINSKYIPELILHSNVNACVNACEAIAEKDFLIYCLPASCIKNMLHEISSSMSEKTIFINASKGLEPESICTVRELALQAGIQEKAYTTLSGPSFALEIIKGKFTACALASSFEENFTKVKTIFEQPFFKLFPNYDPMGTELAGALKNVIAIGAGIAEGLQLGFNATAILITKGLSEITRLGIKQNASLDTFLGLAGIGDLLLTCQGTLSRNRKVGILLAQGKTLYEINDIMKKNVAEGVQASKSAHAMGKKLNEPTPLMTEIYRIIWEQKPANQILNELMKHNANISFSSIHTML